VKEEGKIQNLSGSGSKSWKTLLVLLAGILTFGGPYLVYVMSHLLDLNYVVSMVSGFAMFFVGLALIVYLIRKNLVS